MGADLFARFPDLVAQADEVLGYSIRQLCLEDPDNVLGRTEFTQPALFVTSALSYLRKREGGVALPDFFAGHSLGEFNALFAADAFDFATGVALVSKRGQLMAQAPRGAMAAVIGMDQDKVRELLAASPFVGIDIANINSSNQIIVSGVYDEIDRCDSLFVDAGARYVRLNVSAAFHSRFMREVETEFAAYLAQVPLRPLTSRVVANCTARPYPQADYRELLVRQITQPVRWYESMSWLLARGNMSVEEVGPGDVLTKLFFKIAQSPMPVRDAEEVTAQHVEMAGAAADRDAAPRPSAGVIAAGKPRTVFMYSGQGSQYYAMGKELYQRNTVFRQAMDSCDSLYQALTGKSMLAELYDDARKHEELTDIRLSHPALFSVGYSLTQVLLEANIQPDCVLGYSLGEYVAATVAGAMSLDDAMILVVQQARLLSERTQGGGMLTILTSVDHHERHPELYAGTTIASINFAQNFVVSGQYETLVTLKDRLDALSIVSLLLSVRHGFHSPAVEVIEAEFRQFATAVQMHAPRMPVYSAMRGRDVERLDAEHFWEVLRRRVDFHQLIGAMSRIGDFRFVDLGPTGTLSSFIKYGFGDRVKHTSSINQFGRNVETVSRLVTELSA
jgi:malonyl CoA-acyl carrier protein transacylase